MSELTIVGWTLLICSLTLHFVPESVIESRSKTKIGLVLSGTALFCFILNIVTLK